MNIGLLAVDSRYPNLALMKISSYHKAQGNRVEWYSPLSRYDKVYLAKVFTFTPDYAYFLNADEAERGGTGYDIGKVLPPEIDRAVPDYSLYGIDKRTAYGFLTRGCPNRCKWCVVPQKEGNINPYMDIEEIAVEGRNRIILMDNNVLASDYGLGQIEKIVRMGLRVDFNQGLDARLVTDETAKLLAQVKWLKHIRFGCDTQAQIAECERATALIDKYGYKGEYFFYCILLNDFEESFSRVNHWKQKGRRWSMSEKNRDDKNRWRNVTIAFRMSPEENEELNNRVKLSGFRTKQDYIIQSVLHQKVVATGNPLMLVQFRKNLQQIERELERIEKASDMDGELLTPIRSMLEILEGFKEQPGTLADMKQLTVPNEE